MDCNNGIPSILSKLLSFFLPIVIVLPPVAAQRPSLAAQAAELVSALPHMWWQLCLCLALWALSVLVPLWMLGSLWRLHEGLPRDVIDKFPTFVYSEANKQIWKLGDDALECAVCLGDYRHDDQETLLRILTKCNHAFHRLCIDAWLYDHNTCPICRANLADIDARNDDVVIAGAPAVGQQDMAATAGALSGANTLVCRANLTDNDAQNNIVIVDVPTVEQQDVAAAAGTSSGENTPVYQPNLADAVPKGVVVVDIPDTEPGALPVHKLGQ